MDNLKIFIVEDDNMYAKMLNHHLSKNPDYQTTILSSGNELLQNLYLNPHLVTLDVSLPDISGSVILKRIKAFNPNIEVIVISGQEDVSMAVDLLRNGAYDYLVKDEDTLQRLWNTILKAKENIELKAEISELKKEVQKKYSFEQTIIGQSVGIKKVYGLMGKACETNISVSVTGETGTGKELVAKCIHYNSTRSHQAFVAINMAAIPRELMESELFGYEKGAFTGANVRKIGYFERAHKGTVFLDEIGDLPMDMQAKLLRVLQERQITRIGSTKEINIDVRVIAATHKSLLEEVKSGNFRQDLYYRLLGLPIELPPLRERGKDILLLTKFFMKNFCKENNIPRPKLDETAKQKLLKYHYPGNIRELKAVVELAIVISDGEVITTDDLNFGLDGSTNDLLIEEKTLRDYNIQIIKHFLKKYDDNIQLVAKKLDVGKSTIYGMRQKGDLG